MPKKLTQEEFLERAIELHKNRYDYSKVEYTGSMNKVTIICKDHGEFKQIPYYHLRDRGCGKCGKIKAGNTQTMNNESFIKKAINVHGNKYNYEKVDYINAKTKVTIVCKEHLDFVQAPYSHLSGSGCSKCGAKSCGDNLRSNKNEFLEKATKIHNEKYDYSKVDYINNSTKIIIICKEHNEFLQTPRGHLNGGCKKCSSQLASENTRSNINEFIEKAKKIHYDKYNYSKVEYLNNRTNVIIICKKHGEFLQTPLKHLKGGCKKCSSITVADYKRSNTDEFTEKAKQIHYDKYDYSKVEYIDSYAKIIIICKEHGEFLQAPVGHLSGKGCSMCNNKTEGIFLNKLKQFYPSIITQFRQDWCKNKKNLPFDFCIPEDKIIIELDGEQHFKQVRTWVSPLKQFETDKYKEKCANMNQYSTIRILQKDVWHNSYNWTKEICDAIEKIKQNKTIQNIYLCKNNEYEKYKNLLAIESSY